MEGEALAEFRAKMCAVKAYRDVAYSLAASEGPQPPLAGKFAEGIGWYDAGKLIGGSEGGKYTYIGSAAGQKGLKDKVREDKHIRGY